MERFMEAIDPFVFRLSIFVLAIFVGYYVVWSVTPALHTPLMSVTNAISSVIIVGALIAVSVPALSNASVDFQGAGLRRVILASVNIFGGFLVTSAHARHVQEERQEMSAGLRPILPRFAYLVSGVSVHPGAARAVLARPRRAPATARHARHGHRHRDDPVGCRAPSTS